MRTGPMLFGVAIVAAAIGFLIFKPQYLAAQYAIAGILVWFVIFGGAYWLSKRNGSK